MGPVLLFIFVLVVLAMTWRLVAAIFRFAVAVSIGLLAAAIVDLIVATIADMNGSDGVSVGLATGGVAFLVTVAGVYRSWAREAEVRPARFTAARKQPTIDTTAPPLPPTLEQALARAAMLAPDHADVLARARAACARLLAREAGSFDQAVLDAAATLRNQLPALVEETALVCEGAPPAERRAHVAAMLTAIDQMVGTSEEEQARAKEATRRTLSARLRHIAGRAQRTVPL